ncbi:hypothetical protein [Sphingomonas bacterium]|uniref:hypothetical protein n=1 Tax=Sphingomonas bacterium TaxID=1895847 RepID=UPI001576B30B|nr:hypothetical protein [Sphingomonas bacterium]
MLLSLTAIVWPVVAFGQSHMVASPTTPERLSWFGDLAAPNLSGVWVRAATEPSSASTEGWLPWPPPLTPTYAEKWRQRTAAAAAGKRDDDPVRTCQPPGMPRFDTGMTGPLLIIQTPGRIMLYRDGVPVRRVWLDGRPFPEARNLESFSNGNAMGRYEGGDLLVEVRGVRDQPIDTTGVPHSEDLVIAERFHRVDGTTLRLTVTLTDPTAYPHPLTTTVIYTASADRLWEPSEFLCKPLADYHPDAFVH